MCTHPEHLNPVPEHQLAKAEPHSNMQAYLSRILTNACARCLASPLAAGICTLLACISLPAVPTSERPLLPPPLSPPLWHLRLPYANGATTPRLPPNQAPEFSRPFEPSQLGPSGTSTCCSGQACSQVCPRRMGRTGQSKVNFPETALSKRSLGYPEGVQSSCSRSGQQLLGPSYKLPADQLYTMRPGNP